MIVWDIVRTEAFLKEIRKYKRNREFLDALDKKIQKLIENPESIGGYLSGNLHGLKSTRLIGKFRLIFKIVHSENTVYLIALDHRKYDYGNIDVQFESS